MGTRKNQADGVRINSKSSINISGDVVGGDKINKKNKTTYTYLYLPGLVIDLSSWQEMMIGKVEKTGLSNKEKKELKKQIDLIKLIIEKDKGRNLDNLEKTINILAVMSKDIFEVAITTLVNPLAGIGLVLKKIGDKVKLDRQTK